MVKTKKSRRKQSDVTRSYFFNRSRGIIKYWPSLSCECVCLLFQRRKRRLVSWNEYKLDVERSVTPFAAGKQMLLLTKQSWRPSPSSNNKSRLLGIDFPVLFPFSFFPIFFFVGFFLLYFAFSLLPTLFLASLSSLLSPCLDIFPVKGKKSDKWQTEDGREPAGHFGHIFLSFSTLFSIAVCAEE